MRSIVEVHFPNLKGRLVSEALKVFYDVREVPGIKKKPSTSELLDWIKLLLNEDISPETLRENDPRKLIPPLHGALLKNEQDVHLFERLAFLARRQAPGASGRRRDDQRGTAGPLCSAGRRARQADLCRLLVRQHPRHHRVPAHRRGQARPAAAARLLRRQLSAAQQDRAGLRRPLRLAVLAASTRTASAPPAASPSRAR